MKHTYANQSTVAQLRKTVNVSRRDGEAGANEARGTYACIVSHQTYMLTHARREESIYAKTVKPVYKNYT